MFCLLFVPRHTAVKATLVSLHLPPTLCRQVILLLAEVLCVADPTTKDQKCDGYAFTAYAQCGGSISCPSALALTLSEKPIFYCSLVSSPFSPAPLSSDVASQSAFQQETVFANVPLQLCLSVWPTCIWDLAHHEKCCLTVISLLYHSSASLVHNPV